MEDSDNGAASRSQEGQGVPGSLNSTCLLVAGSRRKWDLGAPRAVGAHIKPWFFPWSEMKATGEFWAEE